MLEEMLECQAGQPAAVEFRLERVYQVHLRRGKIVLKERDSETVRRKLGGRWQRLGTPMVEQDQVVLKRHVGSINQPLNGRPTKRSARQVRAMALVTV
jgi:hypothetical protein